jgi:prophage maintenance system killer protein
MNSEAEAHGGEVLLYEAPDGEVRVDVRLDHETVWLTQAQMVELFGRDQSVVSRHLRNVFADGELPAEGNMQKMHIAPADKSTAFYSLDVIISVGYRVKSRRGVQFRQWATGVLRDHLVRGYTFDRHRLAERGLAEARQTLDLLSRTLANQPLVDDTGRAILDLIAGYADTWRLLLEYDEARMPVPPGARPSSGILDFGKAVPAIAEFKRELMARGEATPLFGNARGDALEAILASIEQTMFGESLYRSREEKAANLLYLVIKDHPFSDGNKRIGSFLFMLYLQQEGMAQRLDPRALTALALLIAESAPTSKDLMIRLIMNMLVGEQA